MYIGDKVGVRVDLASGGGILNYKVMYLGKTREINSSCPRRNLVIQKARKDGLYK